MGRLASRVRSFGPRRALRFVVSWLLKTDPIPPRLYTKDCLTREDFEIGSYTYGIPTPIDTDRGGRLKIGKFCSIASGVTILLGGEHRMDWVTTYPFVFAPFNSDWPATEGMSEYRITKGDVIIGNDVWIGYGALILSGVTIGSGSVIGARAVVTEDVEPYSIVAGCPARVVRKRFDEKTIEGLLKIRWWDWPVEKINKNMHLICSSNLEELLSLEDSGNH